MTVPRRPFPTIEAAMTGGWVIGPFFPPGPDPDHAAFPAGFLAYQGWHAVAADVSGEEPCAKAADFPMLLIEINRVTEERGGPWDTPA